MKMKCNTYLPSAVLLCALVCCLTLSQRPDYAGTDSLPVSCLASGKWLHSFEEDVGPSIVYRHADYPLPRARGRDGIEFRRDGRFVSYDVDASDRPKAIEGWWREVELDDNVINIRVKGKADYTMHVTKCADNILLLERTAF